MIFTATFVWIYMSSAFCNIVGKRETMIHFWFQRIDESGEYNRQAVHNYYVHIETLMIIDVILILGKCYYGVRCFAKGMGRRYFAQFYMWSGTYYITNGIKYCMICIALLSGGDYLTSVPTFIFTTYNLFGCFFAIPTLNYTMKELDKLHLQLVEHTR